MSTIELTEDDIFELKRLRDRAERQTRQARHIVDGGGVNCEMNTDLTREAQHALETLNRILNQL